MRKNIHIILIILIAVFAIIYLKVYRTTIEDGITKNKYVTVGYVFKQKYGARDVSILYKYTFKDDSLTASYPVENAEKYLGKRYIVYCDSLKPENNIIFLTSPIKEKKHKGAFNISN